MAFVGLHGTRAEWQGITLICLVQSHLRLELKGAGCSSVNIYIVQTDFGHVLIGEMRYVSILFVMHRFSI